MSGKKGANGAWIELKDVLAEGDFRNSDEILYSETPRFLVTIDPKDKDKFEQAMGDAPCSLVGNVESRDIKVVRPDGNVGRASLDVVKEAYQEPLSFGLQEMKKEVA
jgi:hypothetical protein